MDREQDSQTESATWQARAALALMAVLLIGAGVVWASALLSRPPTSVAPDPLPLGNAFQGNEKLPVAEFTNRYEDGLRRFQALKDRAASFDTIAQSADWTAFCLTSAVALICGYLGFIITPTPTGIKASEAQRVIDAENKRTADKSPKKGARQTRARKPAPQPRAWIRWFGVLASAGTLALGLASKARANQAEATRSAVSINDALWTARSRWFEAKSESDAAEALRALDQALLTSAR